MRLLSLIRDKWRGLEGTRSPKWESLQKDFVKHHPFCFACNRQKGLEVHHVMPFHTHPKLELDPNNLITLCRDCHLFVGHLNDWKSFNKMVVRDAHAWFVKITRRP